jgi:hypothetical protein
LLFLGKTNSEGMENILPFVLSFGLMFWIAHALIAAVFVTPIVWLSRDWVQWLSWVLISLIVPFSVWMVCYIIGTERSFEKFCMDSIRLGLVLGIGAMVRVAMSKSLSERKAFTLSLVAMSVLAAAVYWIF